MQRVARRFGASLLAGTVLAALVAGCGGGVRALMTECVCLDY